MKITQKPLRLLITLGSIGTLATLVACGGSSSYSPTSSSSNSAATGFPVGLAVGSPTEVNSSGSVAALPSYLRGTLFASWYERANSWASSIPQKNLLINEAQAATDQSVLDKMTLKVDADSIASISSGSKSLKDALTIDVNLTNGLFGGAAVNANCYGPSINYTNHPNAGGGFSANGQLPSGDVGMWLATEGSDACAAAQTKKLLSNTRYRGITALKIVAAAASAGLPTTIGVAKDVSASMAAAAPSGMTITSALITLNSDTSYTYAVTVQISSRPVQIELRHTPGSSTSTYSGVMKIMVPYAFDPGLNARCSVTTGSQNGWVLSSLKYNRNGSSVNLTGRSGMYCGAVAAGATNTSSTLSTATSAFASDGQLKPAAVRTSDTYVVNTDDWLWHSNFSRFAANYDISSMEGSFTYAWQAGWGDRYARVLNVRIVQLAATLAGQAYFGFAGDGSTAQDITSSTFTGTAERFFCNWTNPTGRGEVAEAQYQSFTFNSSNNTWPPNTSTILFAPTSSCNALQASGFTYDVDANGTADAMTGDVTHSLVGAGSYANIKTRVATELALSGLSL